MSKDLTLVLLAGLPGAGKSTLALALHRALGWPAIDVDIIKSDLYAANIPEEISGPLAYTVLFSLARNMLTQQKYSLILDTPSTDPSTLDRARTLADSVGANLKVILCLAEKAIRNQRLARRTNGGLSQATFSKTEGDGSRRFSYLPADTLRLDTARALDSVAGDALAFICGRVPATRGAAAAAEETT